MILYNSMCTTNFNELQKSLIKYFNLSSVSKLIQELFNLGFIYSTNYSLTYNSEHFNTVPLYKFFTHKYSINSLNYYINKTIINPSISLKHKQRINKGFINFYNTFETFVMYYNKLNLLSNVLHTISKLKAKSTWIQLRQLIYSKGFLTSVGKYAADYPILEGYITGLSIYNYILTNYGSRKGIIDTALTTASSGYMTKKLVESMRDILIIEQNCNTLYNIRISPDLQYFGNIVNTKFITFLNYSNFFYFIDRKKQILVNKKIQGTLLRDNFKKFFHSDLYIKHPSVCQSFRNVCANCSGLRPKVYKSFPYIVGTLTGQSLGEPTTQMVLRTFHTGGIGNDNKKHTQDDGSKKLKINLVPRDILCGANYILQKYIKTEYFYINMFSINSSVPLFDSKFRIINFITKKTNDVKNCTYPLLIDNKLLYRAFNKKLFDFIPHTEKPIIFKSNLIFNFCKKFPLYWYKLIKNTHLMYNTASYNLKIAETGEFVFLNQELLVFKNTNYKWKIKLLTNKPVYFYKHFIVQLNNLKGLLVTTNSIYEIKTLTYKYNMFIFNKLLTYLCYKFNIYNIYFVKLNKNIFRKIFLTLDLIPLFYA